ncbi:MAG TPA: GTP cyclohydrolase II [archaeon]|nr:GTP cyclohydrolase II [archaeon]
MSFDSIKEALKDFREGRMLVVVDSPERENEGDLVIAAEKCTAKEINFMISEGKGLVCVPLRKEKAEKLGLKLMANEKEEQKTNFTVSIDAGEARTGISAFERALTIKKIAGDSNEKDFVKPGHIFPLIAKKNLMERKGHTEASLELCRLSGLKEIAVICEIIKENGEMARVPDLIEFKKKWNLKMISIADLIEFINKKRIEGREKKIKAGIIEKKTHLRQESQIRIEAEAFLPTKHGDFKIIAFKDSNEKELIALVKGEPTGREEVLVRIHSQCITGDTFSSLRCDCQNQLIDSMKLIQEKGEGVILYLNQEGRGIGLANKLKAYGLQDKGFDTVEANNALGFEADLRNYESAAEILKELKVKSIELLTNNPEKINGLRKEGIKVKNRIPLIAGFSEFNERYLKTKEEKMGHLMKG